MAKLEMAELRSKDDAALQKQLDDLQQELFNLRFQRAANQIKNLNRLTEVKRDIARIKTLLRERELAASASAHQEAKAQ
jgi:large subunit ribosomal protein L29